MRKSLIKLFAVLLLGLGFAFPAAADSHDHDHSTLIVHLTSNNVWTAQMALTFAGNAQKAGGDVVVFLNGPGTSVANKNIPQYVKAESGKSAHDLIRDVLNAGGQVLVCPGCTKQSGLKIDDRVKGIEPTSAKFMKMIMAPGTRIISF